RAGGGGVAQSGWVTDCGWRFHAREYAVVKRRGNEAPGMKRRVSIARALINRPPIVLYDSPTAGLDPVTSQTIITLILRLRDAYGVTALLATHRLQDGFALANFHFDPQAKRVVPNAPRSEERRVGKERRSRLCPNRLNKK